MEFAKNASKLHQKVGELLNSTVPFKGLRIEQEVAVSDLFPDYPNNKERYDWVVFDLKIVIECHGVQHYKLQTFGAGLEQATLAFQTQQFRDRQKEEIAILNGWTYLVVPYWDEKKIDGDYLLNLYSSNENTKEVKVVEKKKAPLTDYQIEQKKKAKEYRHQQYLKQKAKKRGNK